MAPPVIVGIDPGLSGGVAIWDGCIMRAYPMPTRALKKGKRDVDVLQIQGDGLLVHPKLVVVEKVGAMPGQGVVSMFTFGKGYGKILGMVETNLWPLEEPTPQKWKAVVLAGTDRSKEAAVAYVKKRFPGVNLLVGKSTKPHIGMADAVCLCEYGRRLLEGGK